MITDERLASFINSFSVDYDEVVTAIRKEAEENGIPIIRREAGEFIKMIILMNRPERILEIGAAVGFSAIFMSRFLNSDAHITTIENYPPRIEQAKQNIMRAGAQDKITLLEGDAHEILPQLDDEYDMVFMDAAKGQYINWLPDVMRLMKNGGVLISDNVLQEGDIIESHYLVERRNRTIYKRMREYLYELKHNPSLITSIIPLGDGVTVSVKQE